MIQLFSFVSLTLPIFKTVNHKPYNGKAIFSNLFLGNFNNLHADMPKFYEIFCQIHPNGSISHEFGIVKKCFSAFKALFPSYNEEILFILSKTFTFVRLNQVNDEFNQKKKNDIGASVPKTLRGITNKARFSN